MPDWQQSYPIIYESLAPAYRILPQPQVEQVIRGVFGEESDLDSAEGFLDDIGRTLSSVGRTVGNAAAQAAPVLAKVGPGILSGAAGGAALGPAGIFGGALLGGLGSALGSGGAASAPSRPAAAGPGDVAGQIAGALPSLLGGGAGSTGAVGQLLGALGSPTVQQALQSMLLGPAGNRSVPSASGSPIPAAAVTNLIGMLANRASAEWESSAPFGGEDYLTEDIDTANPEARAAWLYGQLIPGESDNVLAGSSVEADAEAAERWIDDMYDELEMEFYDE